MKDYMVKKTKKILADNEVPEGYDEFLQEMIGMIRSTQAKVGMHADMLKDIAEHFGNDEPVPTVQEFEAQLDRENKEYTQKRKQKK